MEVLYIEAKKKFNEEINLTLLDEIDAKTISLAATIQYIDLIPKVKSYLESKGKKVIIKKGAYYDAQVLGCNSSALDETAGEILIITDGKFHAINNAIQIQKPITVFTTKTLEYITQKEIDDHNKKTLAKQKKFLASKKIGLLVSTKSGQNFKNIEELKLKFKDKQVYIFETDNINPQEFENFPDIKIWINTACSGIARDDAKIINLRDVLKLIK